MNKPVAKLIGTGIVSSLGQDIDSNLAGIASGQGRYQTKQLTGFNEPIDAAYLSASSLSDPKESLEQLLDQVIEQAFADVELSDIDRQSMPIFIGSSSYGSGLGEELYRQALQQNPTLAFALPLDGFTQITHHLRRKHKFSGPDYSFNTACTASANAILAASLSIAQERHPYALVIGMETFNTTTLAGFHGMQLLSDQMMRPFDQRRNGLVLGEGCSALLFSAAEPNAQGITLAGGSSQCDTYSISASNPDGSAIAEVIEDAIKQSDISADDIIAIKAHGTASPLNDDGEAAGMRRVFDSVPPFFSLKSYIGHTLGSCGAIETALTSALISRQKLPISAGFEYADAKLGISPLTQQQAAPNGHYMLNFFGFGGNNCSLIIHSNF